MNTESMPAGAPLPRTQGISMQHAEGTIEQFGAEGDAVLLLDLAGCVQYCHRPQLLGYESATLTGLSLGTLIPDLPLRANTPGYNLAYAGLAFADNASRRCQMLTPNGSSHAVDVSLLTVRSGQRFGLLALLRASDTQQEPAATPI